MDADFLAAFDRLQPGYQTGRFCGERWGVTITGALIAVSGVVVAGGIVLARRRRAELDLLRMRAENRPERA
ncbi:MAG: hypothetical protein ACFE0P_01730 [Oceanicaulis sp.]